MVDLIMFTFLVSCQLSFGPLNINFFFQNRNMNTVIFLLKINSFHRHPLIQTSIDWGKTNKNGNHIVIELNKSVWWSISPDHLNQAESRHPLVVWYSFTHSTDVILFPHTIIKFCLLCFPKLTKVKCVIRNKSLIKLALWTILWVVGVAWLSLKWHFQPNIYGQCNPQHAIH